MPPFPFSRTYYKEMIGDTVLRNASQVVVPAASGGDGSCLSLNSYDSDDVFQPRALGASMHLHSAPEASSSEYKSTVNVGQHLIKVTSDRFELVRMAKLVLDEYFTNSDLFASTEDVFGDTSSLSSVSMPLTPLSGSNPPQFMIGSPLSLDDSDIGFKYNAFSLNNLVEEDDEVFTEEGITKMVSDSQNGVVRLRRTHFLRKKSQTEIKSSSENEEKEDEIAPFIYDAEHLTYFSKSPLALRLPSDWSKIKEFYPSIIRHEEHNSIN